jgi:hypothetical protein
MTTDAAAQKGNPEAVAEDIKQERRERRPRRGRPRGRKDSAPRARRYDVRPDDVQVQREPYVKTAEGVAMSGMLGSALWDLTCIFTHRRGLTADEVEKFGEALDPVLYKYLPVLGDWAAEATLLMCCWSIWQATTPEETDDADESDTGSGAGNGAPETAAEIRTRVAQGVD